MSLNNNKLRFTGRTAQFVLAALLTAGLIGGGLFYASAEHAATKSVSNVSALPAPGVALAATSAAVQDIYCESGDMRRHWCNADTRGGVRLVRQRSDAACIEGRTWGYDRNRIWVDRGCRADFAVNTNYNDRGNNGRGGYGRDRDNNRDYGRGGYGRGGGGSVQTFYCESGDMRRHWCAEGARGAGQVRLVKQRSDAACIEGRTWGRDRQGVWVDRGCRADFEVVR